MTIILNSKNRFDKDNTSPNDCEYLFDWGILADEKYKMTYSLSKYPLPILLTAFQQLMITKRPWGKYSTQLSGNSLLDESGNGRHATTLNVSVINSSLGGSSCLSGIKTSTIIYPVGSIPANYSICCLTRYSGLDRRRILSGYAFNNNYVFSNYFQEVGTCFDQNTGFSSRNAVSIAQQQQWHSFVCVRGNSVLFPNNIMLDGVGLGASQIGGFSVGQLAINDSQYNEYSQFEISQVIVFDVSLTQAEMLIVSNSFNNYKTTGILI